MSERSIIFKWEKVIKYRLKKIMGQRQTLYLKKKQLFRKKDSYTWNLNFIKKKFFLD